MKKLMIAALAAASVGGLFAADKKPCKPGETPVQTVAWVYTWKFSGKTTTGDYVELKDLSVTTGGGCKPTGTTVGECPTYCVIRVPSSLKIQGYTYVCEPTCGCVNLAGSGEAFYATKPVKEYFNIVSGTKRTDTLTDGIVLDYINVIGKKAKDAEVLGTFAAATANTGVLYTFTFAGLGKYDLKNTRVSSASGNFAGTAAKPVVYSPKLSKKQLSNLAINADDCVAATVWLCDASCVTTIPDTSVAYGSWSMKYNSSASKKFYNDGSYVTLPNGLLK